ncbi:MAG TPA: polyhydroxyalkanoic acid system family protein [Acidobacteriota bacterium]
MPSVKVSVPHALPREEATRRIRNAIDRAKIQYGNRASRLQESWSLDSAEISFEAMGFRMGAVIQVQTDLVQVNAQIPMAALPWKSKIESTIAEQLRALLS